ncbi:3-dehydroquinate synthase family protein [Leyella stercorea]|uniref:3-dehydroquinate synthase n=1 Tax=Leyella stercorea TaxID=363265 RepID=UPI0024315E2F|nr:3-dehydroquinate synthase family protein [Leyella stercorea]
MQQRVIISQDIEHDLAQAIAETEHDRVFVLTDDITQQCCLPKVAALLTKHNATTITIRHDDTNKTLATLADVWTALQRGGATRHSLLVNLGGGMVTDLGGFAAATFKRGIHFINIPTTLLAMVDAAVGGKTGINFGGLKNEVGAFANARYVIVNTCFLDTLDTANLCSGYAEMLKHSLISNAQMWAEHVNFDILQPDLAELQRMVAASIAVKERIVADDPHEHGIRKALNFGHTIGHALEEFSMQQPGGAVVSARLLPLARARTAPTKQEAQKGGAVVSTAPTNPTNQTPPGALLHGYAVAFGLIGELYISARKAGFPTARLHQTARFIRENYGAVAFTCDDYPTLLNLMRHDKKNTADTINFTLLHDIGDIRINQTATDEEIREALDFIREGY